MSTMKKLKQQRLGYRLNVENQIKTYKGIMVKDHLDRADQDKLRVITDSLLYYEDKLEGLNSQILDLLDDDQEMVSEVTEVSLYCEKMVEVVKTIGVILAKSEKADANDDEGSTRSSVMVRNQVKLPKLNIISFGGDPVTWQEFWDSFQSTIHDHPDLPAIDKFKYLRSYLSGDALNSIAGYRLTATNYSTVVDVLKERYGNPQIAVFAHFERLFEMPAGDGDVTKFQATYAECETHIRSLVALGLMEDTFGQVFTPIILSKLPKSVRLQLHRQNGSKPWTLSNLREMMKEEITAREWSDRYTSNKKAPAEPKGENQSNRGWSKFPTAGNQKPHGKFPTQGALSNTSKSKPVVQPKATLEPQCAFCSNAHWSDFCDKYRTADERREKAKGTCFKCLRPGHDNRNCLKRKSCYYCHDSRHHSALCSEKFPTSKQTSAEKKPSTAVNVTGNQETPNSVTMASPVRRQIQMQMASIRFEGVTSPVRIFFDPGCTYSYITTELAKKLGVTPSGEEVVSVGKFGEGKRKNMVHKTGHISVPVLGGLSMPMDVRIIDVITCPIHKYPIDIQKHPIMTKLTLADSPITQGRSVAIDMLIGLDHYFDFVGGERIELDEGIILLESKFGYITTGKVDTSGFAETSALVMFRQSCEVPPSSHDIEKFWALEDIGVKENPFQWDDDMAIEQFNKTVRFENGRYAVQFPWKDSHPELPTNYHLALGRLKSLAKKMQDKPEVCNAYDTIIHDQIENGVIEEVQVECQSRLVHYLPHHPVIKQSHATTKVRIVYDASSKCGKNSLSLNDCLFRGPVILQDLCGMLLRFRVPAIAMISDVEKAFLQVEIQRGDRDVTRFLYPNDWTKPLTPSNLLIYRFCRVPFGTISSPFLLGATIQYHLKHHTSTRAADIADNIYVDNVAGGRDSVVEAVEYYQSAKELFSEMSMNIREWHSNSSEFIQAISPIDRGKSRVPKFLGMRWDTEKDDISCQNFPAELQVVTKRSLLSAVSKIFDPCGFFSPVTIRGKMIIQHLWKLKLPWDTEIPHDILQKFQDIRHDLVEVGNIRIPRLLNDLVAQPQATHELHCFCDASASVYAAVIYLRSSLEDRISSGIVFSKTRLAPMSMTADTSVSIPRLELMAVVIGVRTAHFSKEQLRLPIHRVVIWSDSKTVLWWLRSKKILPVFVQSRVKEIRSHTGFQFRYVPTGCNPADLPTREADMEEVLGPTWWFGPDFLAEDEIRWPKSEVNTDDDEVTKDEIVAVAALPDIEIGIGAVMDRNKYSSFKKLIRVSAWVIRFVNQWRGPTGSSHDHIPKYLSSQELGNALRLWLWQLQKPFQSFLNNPSNPMVRQLGLAMGSDGLIRCKGRLEHSDLSEGAKFPILLPKDDAITSLLIQDCHERLFHSGVRQTLAQLRFDYWIPHGPSKVKQVLAKCRICRKAQGGVFKVPESPPLPWFRVARKYPFAHTGVDYLGPLYVSIDEKSANTSKVWIALFTCASTRAVHLEVITDLSAAQFIMCFRRFTAIYGKPQMMISDNAKHFKTADNVLQLILKDVQVQDFVSTEGITWKFIVEKAPWMGGFYERLVGVVKSALKKSLGRSCLELVKLQTLVAEIGAMINSRPLVPVNAESGEIILTPAHFLARSGRAGIPEFSPANDYSPHPTNSDQLKEMWASSQQLLNDFWTVWCNEYLASLRERNIPSMVDRNCSDIAPQSGVVVLLKEKLPRCRWKTGIIESTHQGKDGKIRSATVRMADGKRINRPLKLLCPMESAENGPILDQPKLSSDFNEAMASRPRRKAAVKASSSIRRQLEDQEEMED